MYKRQYLAHFALYAWLAQLLATPLPPPGPLPAVQGVVVGMVLLFGFAVPPLLQLRKVSTPVSYTHLDVYKRQR